VNESLEVTETAAAEPPKRKKQQRSAVTQARLLNAASAAFAESGFRGTSTRDIADRAGVHHPLITYHFKNKKMLWRATLDRLFAEFGESVDSAVEHVPVSEPRARAVRLVRAYVEFAYARPELFRIINHESGHPGPRLDWIVETHLRPAFGEYLAFLGALQSAGLARSGNPALLLNMIRAMSSVLPAMGSEVNKTSGIDFNDAATRDELSRLIIDIFLPESPPA
jgi:TetR/AcrR family transcriptional regulator